MAHSVNQLMVLIGGKSFVHIFAIVLVLRLNFASGITTGKKNDTELNKGEFKRSSVDYTESRKPFDGRRAAENKISFYPHNDVMNKPRTFFKGDNIASASGNSIRGYGGYAGYGSSEEPAYAYQGGYDQHSYAGGPIGPGPNDDHDIGGYNYQHSYHGIRGPSHDNRDFASYDHREFDFDHKGPAYHGFGQHGHDHGILALKGLLLPLAGVALLGAAAALVSNPVLLQLGVISGKKRRKRSTPIKDIFKPDQSELKDEQIQNNANSNAFLNRIQNGLEFYGHFDQAGRNSKRQRRNNPLQAKGDNAEKGSSSVLLNKRENPQQSKRDGVGIINNNKNVGLVSKIESGKNRKKNYNKKTFGEIVRFGDGILSRTRRSSVFTGGNDDTFVTDGT